MKIEKTDRLIAKVDNISKESVQAIKKAMVKGSTVVRRDAKALAPKATGELQESIRKQTKANSKEISSKIYTNKEYAIYQEMGTGQKGAASPSPPKSDVAATYSADWKGNKATPFLYPALENNKEEILLMIKAAIKETIRSEVRKK